MEVECPLFTSTINRSSIRILDKTVKRRIIWSEEVARHFRYAKPLTIQLRYEKNIQEFVLHKQGSKRLSKTPIAIAVQDCSNGQKVSV